jgi:TM2 domain-containing membrane protein YozV
MARGSNPTVAFLLEFIPGWFQWFGWGHIYNGNVGKGLLLMFGYWLLQGINVLLMFVLIGYVTAPITWLAFLILSSVSAKKVAARGG